ncbi:MAG: hypothetical protein JW904_06505 [Spirochaetales bacterium]|nr:hypothetical protein [Spirochaetales bacterium]
MKKLFIVALLIVCSHGLLAAENLSILVSPFCNNSSEEYSWLGFGIEASVISDLSQIQDIAVISTQDRKKALDELAYQLSGLVEKDKVLRVGKQVGANVILSGEYTMIGQDVRLTARLTHVQKGMVISSLKLDGTIHEIFAMQDEIVVKLLSGIDEKASSGIKAVKLSSQELAKIHSSNADFNSYQYQAKGFELSESVPQEFLDIEELIFKAFNAERKKAGLVPFNYSQRLAGLSRYHSMNMQVYQFSGFVDQYGMGMEGRKLVFAPELIGDVGQFFAVVMGNSPERVAQEFVKKVMESDLKKVVLAKNYNNIGIGVFRGDGDDYEYYCNVMYMDLWLEIVSSIPKKVSYGAEVEVTIRYVGKIDRNNVGLSVRFPDKNAKFFSRDGKIYQGAGLYTPEKWNGDFFTVKIKCDKGRGAYMMRPAEGEKYYTEVGVTFIAQ